MRNQYRFSNDIFQLGQLVELVDGSRAYVESTKSHSSFCGRNREIQHEITIRRVGDSCSYTVPPSFIKSGKKQCNKMAYLLVREIVNTEYNHGFCEEGSDKEKALYKDLRDICSDFLEHTKFID